MSGGVSDSATTLPEPNTNTAKRRNEDEIEITCSNRRRKQSINNGEVALAAALPEHKRAEKCHGQNRSPSVHRRGCIPRLARKSKGVLTIMSETKRRAAASAKMLRLRGDIVATISETFTGGFMINGITLRVKGFGGMGRQGVPNEHQ